MQATPTKLLESLSNNDVTFFIPPYQRNYEWSVENCRVLLSDIVGVSTANISGQHTEHFFGSIVYTVESSGFGVPDKYVLTDGQQRITTTMLFLMALRDSIDDETYRRAIQRRYLENDRASEETEYKIKLKQVESDWEGYKLLALSQEVPDNLRSSSVYQNYTFFKKNIDSLTEETKRGLLEHGLTKFSIIAIQLEPDRNPWENPQEIFESMNSLGKPLSLADLVRNYLLMGKTSIEQTFLYNTHWLTLERRLPQKLSEFIRDWMQADQHRSFKVARESNYKELYGAFKETAGKRTVEDLFESFVRFSTPYAMVNGIMSTGLARLDRVIADLNAIGVAPAYSYLTEVVAAWKEGRFTDEAVVTILTAMRTYLLRRRVLGVTQAENKFYPVLGSRLRELQNSVDVEVAMFSQLSSQEYALRLPNDDEMTARLNTMNFYNLGRSRNYPRLLLSMIEESLTKSRPQWDDPHLQLEHIMPQKLNSDWKSSLGPDHDTLHQEYVNNIGNITLIRHNQELGNKSFPSKRETYSDRSGLQVTKNLIIDQEEWGVEAILRRRDAIVSLLVQEILDIPLPFRRGSNWSQAEGAPGFATRETLNQLIGETVQYVQDPRISAEVISDAKVRFEGEEWALGPLTKSLKARNGDPMSKTSNFHGASYWSWQGTRLVDLDL